LHKSDVVFVTARVKRSQVKTSSHPLPTGPIFKKKAQFRRWRNLFGNVTENGEIVSENLALIIFSGAGSDTLVSLCR